MVGLVSGNASPDDDVIADLQIVLGDVPAISLIHTQPLTEVFDVSGLY